MQQLMQGVSIPGFEGREIAVELAFGWGRPRLFMDGRLVSSGVGVDGLPAPTGDDPNRFSLRRNDGTVVTAWFKGGFPDPVPTLVILTPGAGERNIQLAPPLSTAQWVCAGFPLLLLLGGLVGAVFGAIATLLNVSLMRSGLPAAARFGACAGVSLLAFVLSLAVAVLLHAPGLFAGLVRN
jgi:hypothetical protein